MFKEINTKWVNISLKESNKYKNILHNQIIPQSFMLLCILRFERADHSIMSRELQDLFCRGVSQISQIINRLKRINNVKQHSYVTTKRIGRQTKIDLTLEGDKYVSRCVDEINEFINWVKNRNSNLNPLEIELEKKNEKIKNLQKIIRNLSDSNGQRSMMFIYNSVERGHIREGVIIDNVFNYLNKHPSPDPYALRLRFQDSTPNYIDKLRRDWTDITAKKYNI